MHPYFIVVAMTVAFGQCLSNAFLNSDNLDITSLTMPTGIGYLLGQGMSGWVVAFITGGILMLIRGCYRRVRKALTRQVPA